MSARNAAAKLYASILRTPSDNYSDVIHAGYPVSRRSETGARSSPTTVVRTISWVRSGSQKRDTGARKRDSFRVKGCTIEVGATWERNSEGAFEFWVTRRGEGVSRLGTEVYHRLTRGSASIQLAESPR